MKNLFNKNSKYRLKKFIAHLLVSTLFVGLLATIPLNTTTSQTLTETAYASETSDEPNMSNLVVFVNFADTVLTDGTTDHYHSETSLGKCFQDADYTFELFDGEDANGSVTNRRAMKQYLETVSYGQLRLENVFPQYDRTNHKIVPLTLSENVANYASNDEKMISEIISILNANYQGSFPSTTFDHEEAGILDNLMIVVACDNDRTNSLFSGHQSTYGGNENLSINSTNYRVRHYTVVTEGGAYFGISGSGLLIHEFMHTLGYPDLYHRPSNSQETTRIPVGAWDIMSQENYYVQYPLAYMRQLISGWVDLPTVTTSQTSYTLTAASATNTENKNSQAVILKTPYSDNEIFVVEYRKQGDSYASTLDYDCKIPGSGIIIYRVNTSLQTNIQGAPFMVYVYRSGDTYDSNGLEMANAESVYMQNSYLSAESSRTTYGSSDASKTLTDNAITYSDGTNSGIVISNVGSASGDTITFDISFAADDGQYWTTLTSGHTSENTTQLASYIDTDGTAYYIKHEGTGYSNIGFYQYADNTWTRLGSAPAMYSSPKLIKCNGIFYLAYIGTDSYAHLAKWNDGSWTTLHTSSIYASEIDATTDGTAVYFTYNNQDGCTTLYAYKYTSSGLVSLGSTVGSELSYAANPYIAVANNTVFVQYRELFNQNNIIVKKYNSSTNTWESFGALSITSDYASLYAYNNKLYLLASIVNGTTSSSLYTNDLDTNSGWTVTGNSFVNQTAEMDLCVYNEKPYIAYVDSTSNKTYVKELKNGTWTQVGNVLSSDIVTGLNIINNYNELYVTYRNSVSNSTYLRTYTVTSTQASETPDTTPTEPTTPSNPTEPTTPSTPTKPTTPSNPTEPTTPSTPTEPTTPSTPTVPTTPITPPEPIVPDVTISYRTHVQNYGWQGYVNNGDMSGTSGQAMRLEGINIQVSGNENLGIMYTTHVQNIGWLPNSINNTLSGTEGQALRLEAIMIKLIGSDADKYDVYYRVHAQNVGWMNWAKNGVPAGTAGYAYRLEGIQIIVVKKNASFNQNLNGIVSNSNASYISTYGDVPTISNDYTVNVNYQTHVQNIGWQGYKQNGAMSGTEGLAYRLEGIKIYLSNAPYSGDIRYITHVQNIGWQGNRYDSNTWSKNNQMAGTEGLSYRLEGIQIMLTGEMAQHYDIYYRVHVQNIGWMNWVKNGEMAGTEGQALRLECIEIKLVEK